MIRKCLSLLYAIFFIICFITRANAEEEKISITTYYPSPYGVYNELEVRNKMALGEPSADAKVGSLNNLDIGQLYVGNSIIFKSLTSDPPSSGTGPAKPKPGQVIYNSTANMLKFYNGTQWVDMTCSNGRSCLPSDYVPIGTCPTGSDWCHGDCPTCPVCPATPTCPACPACPASGCPDGQTCSPPCPASGCPSGQSCKPNDYVPPCPAGEACALPCPPSTTPKLTCNRYYQVGSPPTCPSGFTQVACLERFSSASSASSRGGGLGGSCPFWNMGYHTNYDADIMCCKAE